MKSKIIIFEGTKEDGIFSSDKKFYPETFTDKDIFQSIKKARISLGNKHNFSGLKMLQATQKMEDNDIYPDNRTIIIGEEHLKKEDLFEEKLLADILIIDSNHKGIAVAHRMGDCPILIAEDRQIGITAITHCNLYHINRGLPKELIKSMINNCHSKEKNIYLYIGSHIRKESYLYETYPKKLTNKEIWQGAITKVGDKYSIDMDKAILNQLSTFKLGRITISPIDTATDLRYASHYETVHGKKEKLGQNIVGFYYQ